MVKGVQIEEIVISIHFILGILGTIYLCNHDKRSEKKQLLLIDDPLFHIPFILYGIISIFGIDGR